ncbi:MAG: glycosyltransferase family 4 protein [Solirubrobacterales bacterium]|nr:glycosyltransferase family 4 protein [Solirubrobacterales bacterium]
MGDSLRIVDVALSYGEHSGGIRTYLEAKADYAARTGAFEHHLVSGRDRGSGASGGDSERGPLGAEELCGSLRELAPDAVLLHDPYWTPRLATRAAHELGAKVIAVHRSARSLQAAGLAGPDGVYPRALRLLYRRAYRDVDAVMSVVDGVADEGRERGGREGTLPLRLGLDPAFHPFLGVGRGDHVLYVGRLAPEKGLRELLEAASASDEAWPLVLLGEGPAVDTLRERVRQLGLGDRVRIAPWVQDRDELARSYAGARCVVIPGPHETFGLVALEAAACGTPVVTVDSAPVARVICELGEAFPAGDPVGLLAAIERARRLESDPEAALRLVDTCGWDAALEAELADIKRLVGQ